MKKNLQFLLLLVFIVYLPSCKDEVDSNPLVVRDGASLSKVLEFEGATRKQGNIPVPTSGNFGSSLEIQTTSIIVTPNSAFVFTAEAEGEAGVLFIKLEGSDEYFEIPYGSNGLNNGRTFGNERVTRKERKGNAAAKSFEEKVRISCTAFVNPELTAHAFVEPVSVKATVQSFEMPRQGAVADLSNIKWSLPQIVTVKAIPTGKGIVTVTLTWDKDNTDLDLWLEEPDGNKIYFNNDVSATGGFLDYDNVEGFGPENIFYENASTMLSGEYKVKVHYYDNYLSMGPVNYKVVIQNGTNVKTYGGTVTQINEVSLVATFRR